MRVTPRDVGVTATKRPRCDALLQRLCKSKDDVVALSMGLGMKRNGSSTVGARVTKGNDGGWVQGACLTARDGAARLTRRFHGQGFLVWFAGTDARRVVFVVGLNWASRLGGSPSSWPSWIPRAGSLPSGQDGFA